MCESCIEPSPPPTPEQAAEHQGVRDRLWALHLKELERRGITNDELLFSARPGYVKPFDRWPRSGFFSNIWNNFQLVLGFPF